MGAMLSATPSKASAGIIEVPNIPRGNVPFRTKKMGDVSYTENGERYRIVDIGSDGKIDLVEKYFRIINPRDSMAVADSSSVWQKTGTWYTGSRGCPLYGIDEKGMMIIGPEKKELFKGDTEGNSKAGTLIDLMMWDVFQMIYDKAKEPDCEDTEEGKDNSPEVRKI